MFRTRAYPSAQQLVNIPARSSLTTLGDSLLAYGVNSTDGFNSNSPVLWCNDLLSEYGAQFDPISMLAAASNTLQNVIDNQLPTALTDGTDIAWLHCGINDLNSTLGNNSVATIMSLYTTIFNQLSPAKRLVIVDSINPVSQSGSTNARQRAATIPQVNGALRQLCAHYNNIIYNDQYSAIIDTTSALLNPKTNYLRSDDGIHYESLGAQASGYATAANILSQIRLSGYKTPGANLLTAFSGTGGTVTPGSGTITGTPPVGWNCAVASGTSAVTITSLTPDMIRFTITNGGVAASTTFIQATNNSTLTAASVNGAIVQGGCGFQASGITNITRINMGMRRTNASNTINWGGGAASSQEPTIIYPTTNFGGYRKFPPYTCGAGITLMEFIIAVNLGALTGALTIDLFNPTFEVLS